MTIASELLSSCMDAGQASRYVPPNDVDHVRDEIRRLARGRDVHIRTAVLEGSLVVIARLDSDVWSNDTAVMREKFGLSTNGRAES